MEVSPQYDQEKLVKIVSPHLFFLLFSLSLSHFSHAQHQPTVTALHVRWLEFFRDYQSFLQWLKTMDLDMSNLNPFVKDMDAVKTQLEKLKVSLLQTHAGTFCCSTVNQNSLV